MNPTLETRIHSIEELKDRHLSLAMDIFRADEQKMYQLDLLALAVIKRSLSLCAGFSCLVRSDNYQCAASLLRLQVDSCLRFFAAFLVEDPHQFALSVLKAVPIRKMKDRLGHPMTDQYLVSSLSEKFPWLPRVYSSTSGFIHLSEKHIFSILQKNSDDGKIAFQIGHIDDNIPTDLWTELADGFLAATDAQFEYLEGWLMTKQNPHLVQQKR